MKDKNSSQRLNPIYQESYIISYCLSNQLVAINKAIQKYNKVIVFTSGLNLKLLFRDR